MIKKLVAVLILISVSVSVRAQVGFAFNVGAPCYSYSPYYGPSYPMGYGFGMSVTPAHQPTYVYLNGVRRDRAGKKYWRIINRLNRSVRITALNGGERIIVAPGGSGRVARGATFNLRVDARNRRSKLFNTNRHFIVLFTNQFGEIDYKH